MTAKEDRSFVAGASELELLSKGLYPLDEDGFVRPEWRSFVAAVRKFKFEEAAARNPSWATGDAPAPRVHKPQDSHPQFIKCGEAIRCDQMLRSTRAMEFGLKRMFPHRKGPSKRRAFVL